MRTKSTNRETNEGKSNEVNLKQEGRDKEKG